MDQDFASRGCPSVCLQLLRRQISSLVLNQMKREGQPNDHRTFLKPKPNNGLAKFEMVDATYDLIPYSPADSSATSLQQRSINNESTNIPAVVLGGPAVDDESGLEVLLEI